MQFEKPDNNVLRLLVGLLLIGGAITFFQGQGSQTELEDGEDVEVTGSVDTVDLEPMTYDGDGIITITDKDGTTWTIRIRARSPLCDADLSQDTVSRLEQGDTIQVRGAWSASHGSIVPCASSDHYLRQISE
jgi:hypothetical protein